MADSPRRAEAEDRVGPPTRPDVAQLAIEHHAALYRYAFRLTGSVQDAEDLTQQTFLAAQQGLGQLRAPDAARGWLFTIMRNAYLKTRRRPPPLAAAPLGVDVNEVAAESVEETDVDPERLQQALDSMSDEYKLVVLMFYFERQNYREIAAALDIPIGTVMSRLSRGKEQLRRRLFALSAEPIWARNGASSAARR